MAYNTNFLSPCCLAKVEYFPEILSIKCSNCGKTSKMSDVVKSPSKIDKKVRQIDIEKTLGVPLKPPFFQVIEVSNQKNTVLAYCTLETHATMIREALELAILPLEGSEEENPFVAYAVKKVE